MKWQDALVLLCTAAIPLLGWLTYRRGSKTDAAAASAATALNVAANVKATYEAQAEINEERRAEIVRLRISHQECEEATNGLRRSLADSLLKRDEQEREIARLKATVDEHEQTITRHELTINQLRAGTPADRREMS